MPTPTGTHGLVVVIAALIGAIGWNLITWWFGLSSSSTHALIGGLIGAALASSGAVNWPGVVDKVIVPMALSPLIGLGLAFFLMLGILWTFHRARPQKVDGFFRRTRALSTGAMAFSHGTQDAQKTMGVIALALVVTGHLQGFSIPLWVIFASAAAMGLGTLSGGWRVIRTLGNRITRLIRHALRRADVGICRALGVGLRLRHTYLVHPPHDVLHHGGRGDEKDFSCAMGCGARRWSWRGS